MKVFVVSVRSVLKYLSLFLLIVLIISIISITGMDVLGVFSSERELPIYCVDSDEKKASITFDCAWGADDIPQILEVLKSRNVKASFFLVGQWAEKFPDKVKLIAEEGHDVANHSYSHLRMSTLGQGKITEEIQLCHDTLSQLSETKINLFRPPYGDYNNDVVVAARKLGYYTIQWNVDSLDWKPGISASEIMDRVSSKINPGSILLFHNDTANTAAILPQIIDNLKSSGYELVPVSQLIFKDNFYMDFDGRQKKKE